MDTCQPRLKMDTLWTRVCGATAQTLLACYLPSACRLPQGGRDVTLLFTFHMHRWLGGTMMYVSLAVLVDVFSDLKAVDSGVTPCSSWNLA